MWMAGFGYKDGRKQFFFEKKNKKTFLTLGHWRFHGYGLDLQKFFAELFFK
jgi:hypothetical protein